MTIVKPFKACGGVKAAIFVFTAILLCSSLVLGADKKDDSKPARYMSRALIHISPEQGKKYLAKTGIGTASRIPNTNMLLVTAAPNELAKAREILKLVDSEEPFVIKQIFAASEIDKLPSYEEIAAAVGNISIGTFDNPPKNDAKYKVIIDIHEDFVIAVAPAEQFEKVISAIEQLQNAKEAAVKTTEPNKPNETAKLKTEETPKKAVDKSDANRLENDEFFNRLLGSLAEAEKVASELEKQKPAEPNAVTVTIEVAKAEETPVETKVEVEPELPVEETKEDVEEPEEVDEPVFIKRTYEPEQVGFADETLELDLPEKLNIVDLIDLVGKYLDLDYMYDPAEVKGDVKLKVQGPIKISELYPLLESALKFRGFVMSRKGNLITIVPKAKVLEIDPQLLDVDSGKVKYGDVIVTRVFQIKHIDTDSAKNLLVQMKLGENISAIPDAGKLIVTGYTYRMGRIEELLKMIDKPGAMKQFRFRQLKYTMAKNLAAQVKTLAEQLGTVSITVGAPPAHPAPAPRRGRKPAPKPAPAPTLKPTAKTAVYLDADERTNRILMIGLKEQLDAVEKLIDSLDVEQQDLRTLRLYDIQYVGAEEVQEKLSELGIISGAKTTTKQSPRITAKAKAAAVPLAAAPVITEEGLVEEPQVVIIEATNSLLVNATAEQHAQIATIIAYVDAEPEQAAINYIVYPLENQDPEELAGILNQLVQETIEETSGGKDSKVVKTTTKKIEEDITIIPEPSTYSLVVYASKKNQQWIGSLISNLDQYRPQVLLDCTLVEITQDDSFKYDLDIISKTYGGAALQAGSPITSIGGAAFSNSRLFEARATSGDITAFFNSRKVQVLLEAVEKKGYGRVMARPKILVNDNQEGEIKTETSTSVAQISSDTRVPDQGTPITTTSVNFNVYKEGVILNIKPHISKGNMLRLEITLNRTDFDEQPDVKITDAEGDKTFPSPPDLISTDITTVSTIPDGTTIILGGLESIDQKKSHSKVPILGDIPLLGGLFRGIDNKDTQSKLYIFVRASIIRPGDQEVGMEDINRVSGRDRQAFEKMEAKFQELQDWPGIKPEPMDPVKILEAD